MTETWLQDTEYQRDYVQVNRYNTVFENRTGKRGGGIGFYLKEQLQYKVRTDLTRNYTDLEILVVEIRGRNKNTPSLVCAVYQPSSIEVEKLEWLEKFEQFLANLYATWNGVLIITGDFNINLLSHENESTNRYKNILHAFSLQQHVTKPTRKGKTLILHISSNISTKLIHCNVISTDEISDHDEPYAIFNIQKERFQKEYKYVRDEKNLDMNKYIWILNNYQLALSMHLMSLMIKFQFSTN